MTSYPGTELEIFSRAVHWKADWGSRVAPYLRGDVLEVGAGIGANTGLLRGSGSRRWVCLEPDPSLVGQLRLATAGRALPLEIVTGAIDAIERRPQFDAILYIDVLEHIEDDRREVAEAAARLRPQGRLIVLAPAHQGLYSEFDASLGHRRRHTRATLEALMPRELTRERLIYLDSLGLILSGANRLLLKQSVPTHGQIQFWDRIIVPVSRLLDPLCGYAVGKSVLGVWTRK